jgi:DNA-binding transcriptional LysR family regulator
MSSFHRLAEIETFVAIAEHGGFTHAAQHLNVSKSHISKQLAALEERLGVQLLNRTTRKVALTDAGRAFLERARQILEDLDDAERAVVQLNTAPRGTLRVSMPMTFGQIFISPLMAKFVQLHPELNVDMDLSDRNVDLIDEGFDLVIRIGSLEDSSLIARRLAPVSGMFVASPAYLAARGVPQNPRDLIDHDCLEYAYNPSPHWRLERADETIHVPVKGRVKANNGTVLRDAAEAGLGIVHLPEFIIFNELRKGTLVQVLPEWVNGERAVWAIYPQNRYLSAKVRACVDFLAEHLRKEPWIHEQPGTGDT